MPDLKGDLAEPPFKLGHTWMIAPHVIYVDVITYPY